MKLLIVVDMQNDFVTGSLSTPEARAIVPKVIDKIKNWEGIVFYTKDSHFSCDFVTTGSDLDLIEGACYPEHCTRNSEGEKFISEIGKVNFKYILEKESFSYCWWDDITDAQLDLFDGIEIIGVCTDICVISNALTLRSLKPCMPITIDARCCAGSTLENHKAALDIMKNCCINIINADEEE